MYSALSVPTFAIVGSIWSGVCLTAVVTLQERSIGVLLLASLIALVAGYLIEGRRPA